MASSSKLDQLCINTIRTLSLDAIQKANSGHPGLPLGMAPAAYVFGQSSCGITRKTQNGLTATGFCFRAGHGSMLIYSLLHLTGYDLSMDELKQFRQLHSKTPGHPENIMTPASRSRPDRSGKALQTASAWASRQHICGEV